MKAFVCQSFDEPLQIKELDVPSVNAGEVLIKVEYCGVNFPDVLITQGKYQFRPDFPFSPGQEVVGQVAGVGDGVEEVSLGDRVVASMTFGGMREYAVALSSNTYCIDGRVDALQAAGLLESYGTAYHALVDRAKVVAGERLVVLGASGGTGGAAVQIGGLLGAEVWAVASSEDKQAYLSHLGAHQVYGYSHIEEALKAEGGMDVVFDPIGSDMSERVFRRLRYGGRHLVVGFASGEIPALKWNLPLLKSASVVGVFWGGFWRAYPRENRKNIQTLLDWMRTGKLKVPIVQTYPLSEAGQAIQDLATRQSYGKSVIKISD